VKSLTLPNLAKALFSEESLHYAFFAIILLLPKKIQFMFSVSVIKHIRRRKLTKIKSFVWLCALSFMRAD